MEARIVSVSVEPRGPSALKHGMLALGWVVGRVDRPEVLSARRVPMNALLETEESGNRAAMRRFREVLDHLEERCFAITIVSGAPGRDFHYINTYLDFCGLPGLNTTLAGAYRPMYSVEDYAAGALGAGPAPLSHRRIIGGLGLPMNAEITNYAADDDALYAYRLYWYAVAASRTRNIV